LDDRFCPLQHFCHLVSRFPRGQNRAEILRHGDSQTIEVSSPPASNIFILVLTFGSQFTQIPSSPFKIPSFHSISHNHIRNPHPQFYSFSSHLLTIPHFSMLSDQSPRSFDLNKALSADRVNGLPILTQLNIMWLWVQDASSVRSILTQIHPIVPQPSFNHSIPLSTHPHFISFIHQTQIHTSHLQF
jgi:hypothetical protein